jgi:hypothetical protein
MTYPLIEKMSKSLIREDGSVIPSWDETTITRVYHPNDSYPLVKKETRVVFEVHEAPLKLYIVANFTGLMEDQSYFDFWFSATVQKDTLTNWEEYEACTGDDSHELASLVLDLVWKVKD